MSRLEGVRRHVDQLLHRVPDEEDRRCGFVHLYGVSMTSALLATRRGLDVELAAVAGMLHDLSVYTTGDPQGHAWASSLLARHLLEEIGGFSRSEITCIASAIAHHSSKAEVHGALDELLKDADVLQHALYALAIDDHSTAPRLRALIQELGLADGDGLAPPPGVR